MQVSAGGVGSVIVAAGRLPAFAGTPAPCSYYINVLNIACGDLGQSAAYVQVTGNNIQHRELYFRLELRGLARESTTLYEPGGREFESLRAHQFIKNLSLASEGPLSYIPGCV